VVKDLAVQRQHTRFWRLVGTHRLSTKTALFAEK